MKYNKAVMIHVTVQRVSHCLERAPPCKEERLTGSVTRTNALRRGGGGSLMTDHAETNSWWYSVIQD